MYLIAYNNKTFHTANAETSDSQQPVGSNMLHKMDAKKTLHECYEENDGR